MWDADRFFESLSPMHKLMPTKSLLLSIVVPAYNEGRTLPSLLSELAKHLSHYNYEVLVVDDGSTDGTPAILAAYHNDKMRILTHPSNLGKGAALRTAIAQAEGDIVVIQDADLEYHPRDISDLIQPILEGKADVVYGSRFHGSPQRVHLYWHRVANRWLTWLSNLFNNLNLSDMETGYKAFTKEVLNQVHIREQRFGVEPELTAKVAKLKPRL